MAKELIVSINGREKKIAIIENDRVTEFYIERGEENQGIVGNIYKGRVMRVLPGMQSAFVDIGLERDAFLYVSDFFDEEEEFERIVIDQSKKGDPAAERAAAERIEQGRLERERLIEASHKRAEPLSEPDAEYPGDVSSREEPAGSRDLTGESGQRDEAANEYGRQRAKRGRGPNRTSGRPSGESATEPDFLRSPLLPGDTLDTPFIAASSSFERVIDEDEAAAYNGEIFKDARIQERLTDQIHAAEFSTDHIAAAEVGSILGSETTPASSFERVEDSDVEQYGSMLVGAPRTKVAANLAGFIDEIQAASESPAFQRISDEERGQDPEFSATDRGTRKSEVPANRGRSRRRPGTKDATNAVPGQDTTSYTDHALDAGAEEEKPKRARKQQASKGNLKRSAAQKGASRSRKAPAATEAETTSVEPGQSSGDDESVTVANSDNRDVTAGLEDAEAKITTGRSRGEFATRRGGRRRRRSTKHPEAATEVESGNGNDQVIPAPETPQVPPPAPIPTTAAPPARTQRNDIRRDPPEHQKKDEQRRSNTRGGPRGGPRRDREQPMITDLLREGQEILVQIAKEPIAKKGARITSHIALPGRFLVYMPTVEHVGVSRKIESDSERVRLRRLIQIIRTEEDVPSGGFIVRTAGVGISEEDLRDDARYLVRLWLDMRRTAEKMKAPSLVHKDLDLVQRLLRDQLSDDFAAIRVDSEDEYQQIVEFINRIQPRMVKRVKLYTRDTPILEAFGVQAEIDKAIKPRVWLRSGGYLVINQTEALVAIDVNTGKFVGRGGNRLEDTITKTNLEAVDEIVRQIRLRDLGGIIVLDLIDMEDRRNRNRVMQALQEALQGDKSPTKVLSFNDFGLVIMTRKRVKQSLERTMCSPCSYCQGAGLVKSPQTVCYEILEEARRLGKSIKGDAVKQATIRVNPEVGRALRGSEKDVLTEIEDYLGAIDVSSDAQVHQEQFDFAFI